MTNETKLGLFVLIGILGLVVSIVLLGNFQFQPSYQLHILFSDIAGLPSKAKVKVAGVEIGGVKDITLEGNKAKVTVWLKKSVQIHRDAKARIVSTGIIGSKYLELTLGSPEAPLLKDGDTIVGIEPISFDQVVQNAMEKLDALVGTFQGPEGENIGKNLSVTVTNLRKISDSLRVALADQESKLVEMVSNFHSFSQDIAEITADNKESIKAAIENISEVSVKLDRVLSKIDQGEGTFGKLVSDKEMGEDLKSTFADLKETSKEAKRALKRINLIEVQWDYKLRYDVRDTVAHHDVGLRVLPRPDKFYFLGASNVARPSDVTTPDPEELNTLNVLIGKNYKQGQAYVGIIRSSGGVGLKVRPFKWDPLRRLEVTAEGYNFFRKAPVAKPKYNLGANIQLTRWANVGAQIEDPYYQSATNVYANVVVRDDDLGYILGLVGLARPY